MDINYCKKYEPIDGKWYITKELGRGAFGTVFEIERRDFGNIKAALKVISIPTNASEVASFKKDNFDLDDKSVTSYFYGFVEEFIKEIQLMSELRGHSNIVSYEDHEVIKHENDIGWDILIRMELLTPLGDYLTQSPITEETVIKLGIDICKALEVCNQYNIIHRDLKPSNIFISKTGDFKLGDFGVARTLEKTSSGLSKKGTYTYMAPEVFKGEPYGANIDIYSLGIVMYRLLNNNMEPFRTERTYSDGELALARRMKGDTIPRPANAGNRLSEVILKACAYEQNDRYKKPSEMIRALESVLTDSKTEISYETEEKFENNISGKLTDIVQDGKTVSMFETPEKAEIMEEGESTDDSFQNEHTVSVFDKSVSNADEFMKKDLQDDKRHQKNESTRRYGKCKINSNVIAGAAFIFSFVLFIIYARTCSVMNDIAHIRWLLLPAAVMVSHGAGFLLKKKSIGAKIIIAATVLNIIIEVFVLFVGYDFSLSQANVLEKSFIYYGGLNQGERFLHYYRMDRFIIPILYIVGNLLLLANEITYCCKKNYRINKIIVIVVPILIFVGLCKYYSDILYYGYELEIRNIVYSIQKIILAFAYMFAAKSFVDIDKIDN